MPVETKNAVDDDAYLVDPHRIRNVADIQWLWNHKHAPAADGARRRVTCDHCGAVARRNLAETAEWFIGHPCVDQDGRPTHGRKQLPTIREDMAKEVERQEARRAFWRMTHGLSGYVSLHDIETLDVWFADFQKHDPAGFDKVAARHTMRENYVRDRLEQQRQLDRIESQVSDLHALFMSAAWSPLEQLAAAEREREQPSNVVDLDLERARRRQRRAA